MNSMFLAILVIAGSLFMAAEKTNTPVTKDEITNLSESIHHGDEISTWEKNGIEWLLNAQSPDGGWGAGSYAHQEIRDPHQVKTDPATTAFAAMALLKAGGDLTENPYRQPILKALDKILENVSTRPDNGRITSLEGTQPQRKLGIHIDASMALQFLTQMRDQITDKSLQVKVDKAAEICIDLIQQGQNANGGWAGGGWAPVLQSAMANNALEVAQKRYEVRSEILDRSRAYQAENFGADGSGSGDAAGIPLYAVASAQRASATEAKVVETHLSDDTRAKLISEGLKKSDVTQSLVKSGVAKDKAEKLAESYIVNAKSTMALQDEAIWEGFGNNGGEEYLSYLLTSESLAQQNKNEWLKWKQSIEPKFKESQNPNGSWSGHHCITSPVFCTAAIIQTLNVRE